MPDDPRIEPPFPSTNFAWKRVKIKPPPAGHVTARAKRGRWWGLATWPRSRSLTITVSYRGGPESWWLVKARGRHGVFPGVAALEDVMASVFNEWNGPVWSPNGHRNVSATAYPGATETDPGPVATNPEDPL